MNRARIDLMRRLSEKLIQGDNEEWSTLQARAIDLADSVLAHLEELAKLEKLERGDDS